MFTYLYKSNDQPISQRTSRVQSVIQSFQLFRFRRESPDLRVKLPPPDFKLSLPISASSIKYFNIFIRKYKFDEAYALFSIHYLTKITVEMNLPTSLH